MPADLWAEAQLHNLFEAKEAGQKKGPMLLNKMTKKERFTEFN